MPLYYHEAEVKFVGPFPVDMLRYDSCFPADQESVQEIANSLDPSSHRGDRKAKVGKYSDGARGLWTKKRWESFGAWVEHKRTRR